MCRIYPEWRPTCEKSHFEVSPPPRHPPRPLPACEGHAGGEAAETGSAAHRRRLGSQGPGEAPDSVVKSYERVIQAGGRAAGAPPPLPSCPLKYLPSCLLASSCVMCSVLVWRMFATPAPWDSAPFQVHCRSVTNMFVP